MGHEANVLLMTCRICGFTSSVVLFVCAMKTAFAADMDEALNNYRDLWTILRPPREAMATVVGATRIAL